jgi:hypothetical protein
MPSAVPLGCREHRNIPPRFLDPPSHWLSSLLFIAIASSIGDINAKKYSPPQLCSMIANPLSMIQSSSVELFQNHSSFTHSPLLLAFILRPRFRPKPFRPTSFHYQKKKKREHTRTRRGNTFPSPLSSSNILIRLYSITCGSFPSRILHRNLIGFILLPSVVSLCGLYFMY